MSHPFSVNYFVRRLSEFVAFQKASDLGPSRSFVKVALVTAAVVVAGQLLTSAVSPANAQQMTLPGKFDVSSNGTAGYEIRIVVPPGTAGMVPSLTLAYSSQGGNGLVGMGWSLSGLPSIGRCPKTAVQDSVRGSVAFASDDRFCLDGQRLVAISGTYGADSAEYRTEIESFSRVISRGTAGNGPSWFEVRTKSGQVMEFGHTTDSLILAQGKTTARSWGLNKVSDSKGNYFTITYVNDTTNGQAYPTRIDYTGNSAAGQSPYNSVQFIYATRPDISPQYHAGSLSKTTVRLTNVKTFAGATAVADYRLAYQSDANRSILSSVTLCDGSSLCLPATTFQWKAATTGKLNLAYRQVNYPTDGKIWRTGDGVYSTFVADINGDGKSDIIQIGNSVYEAQVLLSNGDGSFTRAFYEINYPVDGWVWRTGSDAATTYFADVDGDGKTDIIQIQNGASEAHVLLSNGDGTFRRAYHQVNYPTDGKIWRTGDGVYSTFVADINGDGKADIIQIGNSVYEAQVLLSNGDGSFNRAFYQTNYPVDGQIWRTGSDAATTYFADIDGDGKADLVQIMTGYYQAQVLLSNGDGSFRRVYQQVNYPTDGQIWRNGSDLARWFLGDVDGDGRADVIQIMNGDYQAQVLVPDGNIVGFISSITNGLGATTSITYQPLTNASVYTKDSTAVYPLVDMQLPIYVVSRVDNSNGVGGVYSSSYAYTGAKGDASGRGFLGFRQMKVTDLQTNVVNTTTYRQNFPYVGLAASSIQALGTQSLNTATQTYQFSNVSGAASVSTPSATNAPYRVSVAQAVSSGNDLDGIALPTVTTGYQYDAYGNATQVVVSTPDGFSKTTTNTFTNNTTNWLLGRLTASSVTSQTP